MNVIIMPVGALGTNCYLLCSDNKSCFIIDPGAQPNKIIEVMEERELTPRAILLTHGHYDHIGAVNALLRHYSDIQAYIGAGDMEVVTEPAKSSAVQRGMPADEFIIHGVQQMRDGDVFDLDELQVKALETPGHSRGGITFLCQELMFAGDTLFQMSVGRTDLYGGDYGVLKQSLAKLCALPGDYEVYPGHGPSTTLGFERRHNPYINE